MIKDYEVILQDTGKDVLWLLLFLEECLREFSP